MDTWFKPDVFGLIEATSNEGRVGGGVCEIAKTGNGGGAGSAAAEKI